MVVKLIAAVGLNGVIGNGRFIPWDIPDERKLFKVFTQGHIVLMGRKTWESLPGAKKPLSERINVVVSKSAQSVMDLQRNYPDILTSISLNFIIKQLQSTFPSKIVWICGGEQIYHYSLEKDLVDEAIVSYVRQYSEGDTFFPAGYLRSKFAWPETIKSHSQFHTLAYKRLK